MIVCIVSQVNQGSLKVSKLMSMDPIACDQKPQFDAEGPFQSHPQQSG
jgi:hypothetical protein